MVIDSADVLRAAAALTPPAPPKMTIREAVDRSERDFLVTLRAKTADDLDIGAVPPHTVPAMTRLLRDLDKEIRAIDARAAEEARESDATPDEEWDAEAL